MTDRQFYSGLIRLREDVAVRANAVLGGLHQEYFLAPTVAPLSICG
jgi:hypothetical protein